MPRRGSAGSIAASSVFRADALTSRSIVLPATFLSTVCCILCRGKPGGENNRRERNRVSRLKSVGLQDKALQDCTFENDKGFNPEMDRARAYVERWEEMLESNTGLLLWGDVGTGKTFFAGCIANALIERGVPVLMTNFARILNTLTDLRSEERNRFIDEMNEYPLLILDDLGIERNSEFALEQVFNVVDSRYRSGQPLIVTTNLTLSELKNPADLAHARIYDRVLERCVPLKINNRNIRKDNAKIQMERARALFATKA
ncbi:MAG: ATP-binding protein [Clostridia bacterium]|nr:ATP-binding protein [Clostridia bacterium]MBR0406454.1 ATP-binding protein [Clostridia bacterium]